jgi:hexosaminidase
MKQEPGSFKITKQTAIYIPTGDSVSRHIAAMLVSQVYFSGGPRLEIKEGSGRDKGVVNPVIIKMKGKTQHREEYRLKVTGSFIELVSADGAGLFRGLQTLYQLMPSGIVQRNLPYTYKEVELPCVSITDFPRYPYRGMHLDVSRHFFPKEFIKRYIDLIALYKMNTFHWHLTDDNGWRIEIRKYPLLTSVSAWRVDREDQPWGSRELIKPGEKATYGGFYTQEDIREIVRYAADRYITIIPEIEMPAHSVEVLAAYPQFSCTGGPFSVLPGSYWPNADILCAGNDSVFTFLEDVLTEIMDLFPSQYIHAGGDEADKANWKKCPRCQARMAALGLTDEKELQSYFMKRMEKFIVSKGRRMIGWDEILEGGLAPEATVMSWRGVEGGIAAARQGHDAIMTPSSHCYFDYYQADPEFEPKAIGGFITLKKVYSYDPTPAELSPREARHILGAQGNVWTEFIATPSHVEYMAVPRMIALAEVTWSPNALRNWDNFRERMEEQYIRLAKMQINYSKGSFRVDVKTHPDPVTGKMFLELSTEQWKLPIHYTLDGSEATATSPVYTGPVEIKGNGIVRAAVFQNGKPMEKAIEMPLLSHLALGKPVDYAIPWSYRYPASGTGALTDGLRGSVNHRDGLWQGFHGTDVVVIIDLGKEIPVNTVQTNFLQNQRSWIFLPQVVEYSLSTDGKKYHSVNEVLNNVSPKEERAIIQPFNFQFMAGTKARYIQVKAKSPGKCPPWHEGAGEDGWIFLDEVVVY